MSKKFDFDLGLNDGDDDGAPDMMKQIQDLGEDSDDSVMKVGGRDDSVISDIGANPYASVTSDLGAPRMSIIKTNAQVAAMPLPDDPQIMSIPK